MERSMIGRWRMAGAILSLAVACGFEPACALDANAAQPKAGAATSPAAALVPAPAVGAPVPASAPAPALAGVPAALERIISATVPDPRKFFADSEDMAAARQFYAARGYAPMWLAGSQLSPAARTAMAELQRADDWGLRASDFYLPASLPTNPTDDALGAAELTLTRAVLKYARFAKGGRIPDPAARLSGFIDRKPQILPPATVLAEISAASAADDYLRRLHPQQPAFESLRQAYLKARREQQQSAAAKLPPGPTIKPGQRDAQIAILRSRLGVPAADPAAADIYDEALVAAVKAFQDKSGLRTQDGRLGTKTRAALNAATQDMIPALLANMEQWRWMPASLGATHVAVNIPQFEMRYVEEGRTVLTERVVTGKPETATPLFSADMQTIVFQPKWGVPDSIKINELLPRLQDGRGLRSGLRMALNGREVNPDRIDWSRADITRYQVYQPSGDDNALGLVKFLFPNKNAVYLHDTPSKALFNASIRAFSHGCVRLRNPVSLAQAVLARDKGWDAAKVRSLAEDGPEDDAIKLDTRIPVHITYFTLAVDAAGNLTRFPDVYGHERRIILVLEGRVDQIVKLDPLPLGQGARTAVADNDERPTVRYGTTRFAPPSALGAPPPETAAPEPSNFGKGGWGGFKPAKPGRYSGNSTNDVIMRALGGF